MSKAVALTVIATSAPNTQNNSLLFVWLRLEMQVPPLVILQFAPGEASNSVKKADGGDWAATSEKSARSAALRVGFCVDC